MKRPNQAHIEKVARMVNHCPYFELLSMKLQEVGIGYSVLQIDLAHKHLQPFGVVHGGVFASIIDAAAFWAAFYEIEDPDTGMTTVDLKLNYLAPASPQSSGRLIARGRCIKLGKTLGYADAQVSDKNGTLLAHGSSTLMLLPGRGLSADSPLPPKFI